MVRLAERFATRPIHWPRAPKAQRPNRENPRVSDSQKKLREEDRRKGSVQSVGPFALRKSNSFQVAFFLAGGKEAKTRPRL